MTTSIMPSGRCCRNVWQDVVFRSLIDLAVNDSDSALHNSLLTEALLGGHVATQILALRRLIDDGSTVLSLRRLLKDIKQNASLITRENFVCFDGLPTIVTRSASRN